MEQATKVRKQIESSLDSDMSLEEISNATEKIKKLKDIEDKPWYKRVKIDTLIAGGIEIAGLILVLNYDQLKVISTIELNRIPKLKIKD